MRKLVVVLLSAMLLASGCAFASHRPVVIKPAFDVKPSSVGQGRDVWINVSDERPRSTLGTRGVRGVGSEIGVLGDLRVSVRDAVADGLRELGFLPVKSSSPDNNELRIEIRNLDYTVTMGFFAGTLRTECGLKAVCILGKNRPFEHLYRGEFEESVQVIQSEEANERYINIAVSRALNALLADQDLLRCLGSLREP